MDVSGKRSGIIITRGVGNGKLVTGLIPAGATVYAWKQNDELKKRKRAGDEWLKDVVQHAGTKVLCPKTPSQFKDLNDWTRAGATDKDLLDAMVEAAKSAAKEAQSRAAKLARLLDSMCALSGATSFFKCRNSRGQLRCGLRIVGWWRRSTSRLTCISTVPKSSVRKLVCSIAWPCSW
jgi:hypothetical protein